MTEFSDDEVFEEGCDNLSKNKNSENGSKGVNAYFLLDLRLPDPKFDGSNQSPNQCSSRSLPKFGFIELLEKIHGKDLRTNNPWLNPNAKARTKWRYKKEVRFSTTEITTTELPYCRRRREGVKPGQLHAPSCSNSAQETVEVLGEHVWQNRVFILDSCKRGHKTANSPSRAMTRGMSLDLSCDDESDEDWEEEGYYRAGPGSLEELGVFDSVELAKQRLQSLTGAPVVLEEACLREKASSAQDYSVEETDEVPPLHPHHMVLELGSPMASDEDSITTASTLKLSDSAYSESPDDAVFASSHSSEVFHEGGAPFTFTSTSTSQNSFEMFETPKFRKVTSDYGSSGSDFRLNEVKDEGSDNDLDTNLSDPRNRVSSPVKLKHYLAENHHANHSVITDHPEHDPTSWKSELRDTVVTSDNSVLITTPPNAEFGTSTSS